MLLCVGVFLPVMDVFINILLYFFLFFIIFGKKLPTFINYKLKKC